MMTAVEIDPLTGIPAGMPRAEPDYSNYDHTWDEGAKEALESGEFAVTHAAWHFNAKMWRDEDGYHSAVWQFHCLVDTLTAATPDELVALVNEKYGSE